MIGGGSVKSYADMYKKEYVVSVNRIYELAMIHHLVKNEILFASLPLLMSTIIYTKEFYP